VRPPLVPVTVTVTVPTAAELSTFKVRIDVPGAMTEGGLRPAVMPPGRPLTVKSTVPLKPFREPTEIVLLPLLPCATVRLVGEADSEKFGAAVTVSVMLVVWVRLPLVPVMVTVAVPVVAEPLAVNVRVLVLVVLAGLNVAVTPAGRPEADKLTLPLKPFKSVSVIVVVPLVPWTIETLVGDADSEKSGGATVVKLTLSKVEVFNVVLACAQSAKPAVAVAAMVTLVSPTSVHVVPSGEL